MAKLLNAVTTDASGEAFLVTGPTSIFFEGSFGGGTVSLQAARTENGTYLEIASKTAPTIIQDNIAGAHYLKAVLSGATGASLTVATIGP